MDQRYGAEPNLHFPPWLPSSLVGSGSVPVLNKNSAPHWDNILVVAIHWAAQIKNPCVKFSVADPNSDPGPKIFLTETRILVDTWQQFNILTTY